MDRAALESQVEALVRVAKAHEDSKETYARSIVLELFEDFLAIEERFAAANKDATEQEVIDSMRRVPILLILLFFPALKIRLDAVTSI